MTAVLLGVVLLGLWVSPGWAGYFICGNGPRAACAETQGLTNILPSIDATLVTDPTCVQVSEAQVVAQKALIQSVVAAHANGRCHLKREGDLAVAMTPPEQDAVNAAILAKQQDAQTYEDAVTNNDLCNATLAEIRTRKTQLDTALQGDIDGITNIANAKTELSDMMGRLTASLLKLMECIRGRAGPPQ